VLPGGNVAGDRQVSESLSVRFHHRDHPGVLVTCSYYAAVDEQNPPAITVDRETELMVCTDPEDPGGTEVWSGYRWTALQSGFATVQVATDAALRAAQAHLVCQEPWAGRPSWTPRTRRGHADVDRHLDRARVRASAGSPVVPGRAHPGLVCQQPNHVNSSYQSSDFKS
jgi:hypothetical protein